MCWALDFLTPLPDLESAPGFRKAGASAGHPMSLEMPWSQSQTESERERDTHATVSMIRYQLSTSVYIYIIYIYTHYTKHLPNSLLRLSPLEFDFGFRWWWPCWSMKPGWRFSMQMCSSTRFASNWIGAMEFRCCERDSTGWLQAYWWCTGAERFLACSSVCHTSPCTHKSRFSSL